MMEYKGYLGHIEFDDEAGIFHGEVMNTRDVITFQGASVSELRKAFRESIEDYLDFCRRRGEETVIHIIPSSTPRSDHAWRS